jgi:ABC-type branched-subunit amino acid transport system substrate-binding protein
LPENKRGVPRRRATGLTVAGVLCATVALAGCGSSSDDTTGTAGSAAATGASTSASTTSAATPKGTPVKLGVVYTSGSPVQNSANLKAADEAAVKALNARGGLAGHPVELVACDDKGDPNQTTACGRQLVKEKVAGQVGGILINGAVLQPVLAAAKIPQIGITPYVPAEFNAPNVFLFNGGGYFASAFTAAYAGQQKLKVSVVAAQTAAAQVFVDGMKAALAGAGGKLINTVPVQANQADWAPIIAGASRNGADTVLDLVDTQQTKQLLAANEAAGAPIKHVMTVSSFSKADAPDIGGEAALANVNTASPFPPFTSDSPMMERFRTELAAEEKSGDGDAALSKQDLGSFGAWLSVQALEQLAKDGSLDGDITAASVTSALNAAKDVDLGGVIPPWTPSAPGPKGFSRASNTSNYMIVFDNGVEKLLTPEPLTIEEVNAGKGTPFPAAS